MINSSFLQPICIFAVRELAILKMHLLQLLLSLSCLLSWGLGLHLAVHRFQGTDSPECMTSDSLTPCRNLSYIIQQLQDSGIDRNISIIVQYILPVGEYRFENISNLRLERSRRHGYIRNCVTMPQPSGFVFSNVTDLRISNFFIRECGIRRPMSNHTVVMQILNCNNVTLEDCTFSRGRETALLFDNTFGDVSIVNVNFADNALFSTDDQFESHSGGIEILFSLPGSGTRSQYVLENCVFRDNTAPRDFHSFSTSLRQDSEWRGQSTGGGLGIYFQDNSSDNSITITDCTFVNNRAKWGGGMHVTFQNEAIGNRIEVIHSRYISNHGEKAGGGVCIRYFRSDSAQDEQNYNEISFQDVEFSGNDGDFGAGVTMLGTYSRLPSTSRISFHNCTWSKNTADYSPAVNIGPALFERLEIGHLPIPKFDECSFIQNSLHIRQARRYPDFHNQFSGTFIITKSEVHFSGETRFLSNSDSALYINSGMVVFKEGSDVLFAGNKGSRGAAIAAYGYTSVIFNQNSHFNITQNHASELGAGIYYQSFDQHDFKTGRECFLKVNESSGSSNNITISFENNEAEIAGTSVFASTLFPCFFSNRHELSQNDNKFLNTDVLNFIGNVTFDSNNNNETVLATIGRRFDLSNIEELYRLIPGELVNIPLHLIDEFGRNIESSVSLLVNFQDKNITSDRKYTIRGQLRLFGKHGATDILRIIQVAPRKVILHINITMLDCPPGYYLDLQDNLCRCSSYNTNQSYYGLVRCDTEYFNAYLLRGFWVGYIPHDMQHPQNLHTAVCPLNFCKLNSVAKYVNQLPNVTSNLSNSVCGLHRQGILCGDCVDGFTPFFHSEGFECGSNEKCSVGIVFYILSELIPVVILFTVIITLDFSFTSGSINGFVLFSQLLETLSVDLRVQNKHTYRLMIVTRVFYDIFNFDYFSANSLSFCLWKGATVIDLLAFKYVTVIFAFALVICLILIMNYLKCSKIEEALNIKERLSVTKGLSAFLVICYLQCARTSFYIITPVILRAQGGVAGDTVTFFGGLPFFKGRHLFYTIAATFFIITVVVIPPLVLILYPLLLQILALCKLSEHWLVCKLLKVFQIYRLKPLIDSFQGCYRDKFRFFAGLYFLYRVIILAGYSITRSTSQFYVISQFLLVIFLGVHSIIQPYKKKAHNIIDAFIFLNLVLINGCSIFIDVYNVQSRENQFAGAKSIISLFVTIQIILIYLPMVCFLAWMGRELFKFVLQHCKCATINKNLFKRQRLIAEHGTYSSDDEGLFNTLDFHEMKASSKVENLVPITYQVTKPTENKPPIIINTVAVAS